MTERFFRGGLVERDERTNLFTTVRNSDWEENVNNKGLIDSGASTLGKRDKCPVCSVPISPEIYSSGVAMLCDKFRILDISIREREVI
jgi:hypothetical protein